MNEIGQLLNKPFPEAENRGTYFRTLSILSVFVTLFLYIFEPFGISLLESNKFLICLGFGSMTFLGAAIYELLVHVLFKVRARQKVWTFWKWLINNMGIVLFVSLANFLFARLLLFGYIDWSLFPPMLYGTFMIGIIPFTIMGGYTLLMNEKKYQLIAEEINHSREAQAEALPQESRLIFDIPIHKIRYIEALQNYAKIAFINAEGALKVQTERTTLKQILEHTEGTPIIKCHRSYLVNTDAIMNIAGNAQGLLLSLSDCEKIIPVSRTRVPLFRQSQSL